MGVGFLQHLVQLVCSIRVRRLFPGQPHGQPSGTSCAAVPRRERPLRRASPSTSAGQRGRGLQPPQLLQLLLRQWRVRRHLKGAGQGRQLVSQAPFQHYAHVRGHLGVRKQQAQPPPVGLERGQPLPLAQSLTPTHPQKGGHHAAGSQQQLRPSRNDAAQILWQQRKRTKQVLSFEKKINNCISESVGSYFPHHFEGEWGILEKNNMYIFECE